MLNFLKSNFRYELIHSDKVKPEKIESPEALVNYVIGVNNHLYKKEEQGWLYVEKIKETKKGNLTLYAMKIDLPILEDNSYFDNLLSPFYTKKKLTFEEIILPEATVLDDSNVTDVPPLPKELENLIHAGNERLDLNEAVEATEEIETDTSSVVVEQQTEQQQEIEELKWQLAQKQQEVELLTRQEEQLIDENIVKNELEEAITQVGSESITEKEELKYSGLSLDSVQEDSSESSSSISIDSLATGDVSDMLELVKQEFSTRLALFIEEETKKIEAEIKELDRRHLIEAEITQKTLIEKKNALESEQTTLQNERQAQLTKENERHEATVATIERNYADKKVTKEQEISTHFAEKLSEDISLEYKRQTEQLSRILQGKKDELSFKQKQMNEGLKENFTQVLATFNESHERVIEQMEQQKVANQPIDFMARKKAVSE